MQLNFALLRRTEKVAKKKKPQRFSGMYKASFCNYQHHLP